MKDFDVENRAGEVSGGSVRVLPAIQGGTVLNGVYVEVSNGSLSNHTSPSDGELVAVELPTSYAERRKFLANWSEKNRATAKKGLGMSILLLPLAACGGDEGGSTATETLRLIEEYL